VQGLGWPTESNTTLYDVLEDIQGTSIEDLEIALEIVHSIKVVFDGSSQMPGPTSYWGKVAHSIECEILERTLLQQCTTSNITP
jgi:hypothetical protein